MGSGAPDLHADRIILKSGIRYYDVSTIPIGGTHRVRFARGRTIIVPNHQIRFLRISPVSWAGKRVHQTKRENRKQRVLRPLRLVILGPGEDFPAGEFSTGAIANREPLPQIPGERRRPNPDSMGEHPTSDPLAYRGDGNEGQAFFFSVPTMTPLLRSLIVPGWGQFSTGYNFRGSLFLTTSTVLLGRYAGIYRSHSVTEKKYNDPWTTSAIAMAAPGINGILLNVLYLHRVEGEVGRLEKSGNDTLWMLGFVWLINVADIIRIGEMETFSLQAGLKSPSDAGPEGAPGEESLYLRWQFRF